MREWQYLFSKKVFKKNNKSFLPFLKITTSVLLAAALITFAFSQSASAQPHDHDHEYHDHDHDHDHESGFHGFFYDGLSGLGETLLQRATAAFDETALDSVFAQASFASNPIDLVFNPTVQFVAPSLLSLDSDAETNTLLNASDIAPFPGVNLFFVDAINFCGGPGDGIAGCAGIGGNSNAIAIDAGIAGINSALSTEVIAHELGHNLGLNHDDTNPNLLSSFINGNTTLSAGQVATIRNSPLVQADASGSLFIEITPIEVVAPTIVGTVPRAGGDPLISPSLNNGSFENVVGGGPAFGADPTRLGSATQDVTLPGWTIQSTQLGGVDFSRPQGSSDGDFYAFNNQGGEITLTSDVVTEHETVAGDEFSVFLDVGTLLDATNDFEVRLIFGGVSRLLGTFSDNTIADSNLDLLTTYGFGYIAGEEDAGFNPIVQIFADNVFSGPNQIFIDNVRLSVFAVPEPSSGMVLAFTALLFQTRRRRTQEG